MVVTEVLWNSAFPKSSIVGIFQYKVEIQFDLHFVNQTDFIMFQ